MSGYKAGRQKGQSPKGARGASVGKKTPPEESGGRVIAGWRRLGLQQRIVLAALTLLGLAAIIYLVASWTGSEGAIASPKPGTPHIEGRAMGAIDAPVQIVIYYDPQCSACATLHENAEADIIERYVPNGKVRLEMRPFAVMGPDSVTAAMASLCAADQNRFWEYRDALFKSWRQQGRMAYSPAGVRQVAEDLRLDREAFESCLNSGAHRAEVEELVSRGKAEGVGGVPATSINGRWVLGADRFEVYARIIDEELSR